MAAALTLGAGAFQRRSKAPRRRRSIPWEIGLTYRRLGGADYGGKSWTVIRWECQSCAKLLGMAQVDHVVKPVFKGGKPFDPEANLPSFVCLLSCREDSKIDKGQLPDVEREAWVKYLAR